MIEFLKNTEEAKQVKDIVVAMASKNRDEAWRAREVFAALVGPVIPQVVDQLATSKALYKDISYNFGTMPRIPVDMFQDNDEGLYDIWSIATDGGLATNEVFGGDEYAVRTYKLASAVSFAKEFAAAGQVDVIAKILNRMAQEILVKQEYQAWSVVCRALGSATGHLIQSVAKAASATRNIVPEDFNQLLLTSELLRSSWAGGTPASRVGQGVTDIFLSPQSMAKIRAMAYNPVNNLLTTEVVTLPEAYRAQLFNSSGTSEFMGKKITVLRELGVGKPYTQLLDQYYSGTPTLDSSTEEVILGVDLSVDAFIRVIAQDSDTGSTFTLSPDDQFVVRSGKLGYYGSMEEGRICGDNKAVVGLIW